MSEWFKKYRHSPNNARLRLFCFPYAGGSAAVFEGWEKSLPPFVDVFAIQAPGRTVRFMEKPISNLREKVSILADRIKPFLDVPAIFVGHSNGALTAFELARELQRRGDGENIRHVVISAKRAPHLPKSDRIHDLPLSEFVQRLRLLKATPVEVLENQELMAIFEPMLRADFALSETHRFHDDVELEAPATLFWGEQDEDVPREDMLAWGQHVVGDLELVEFSGDHFFINSQKSEFLARIRTIVGRALELPG
jgi:medium-chain acyl-[acyl-carrier-protein] hydrolase